ncbi:Na(+)/H(+) exchange regulatory cofactor NHE-RF1-like protein, partial [Lates japonicus]
EVCTGLRPRLCVIQRGSNGYGFNLHSERARPGQYIRAVDEDSPAERAGLLAKDRILQVNGAQWKGRRFRSSGGHQSQVERDPLLVVVDPTDASFFKRCRKWPPTLTT